MFTITPAMEYELSQVISESAKKWAENRKSQNQTIGEDRAEQEVAFRDAIISQKSEKIGKSEKFFWVTVNPRKDVELPKLITTVSKMYKKKWIQNYFYVYETTKNNHNHSHGLIKAKYESARARKELGNSVKDICDISNVHCFKFVELTEEKAKQKLLYMLGQKKTQKLDDVQLTQEWREKEHLKPYYSSEVPPILLEPREKETSQVDNIPEWEFDL